MTMTMTTTKTKARLVEVRPLPRKKWHGKEGKEAFGQPKEIEVLYDIKTGRYATGMSEEEADRLGKLMGVDLSDTFNYNEPHPYYSTKAASFKLPIHTVFFDPNKPAELVKIYNMKASKYVANSMKEAEEGKWPFATHVLFDESEDVNLRATRVAMRDECVMIKMKMTDQDKSNLIQVIGERTVRGQSSDFINVELDAIINDQPEQFLKYAKMGREEIYIRASVLECILKNILTQEGSAIYYMGDLIGYDKESAYDWFRNPQNGKIKVAILDKLTSR